LSLQSFEVRDGHGVVDGCFVRFSGGQVWRDARQLRSLVNTKIRTEPFEDRGQIEVPLRNIVMEICRSGEERFRIVTPRMHGIHHSIVREEQNSNWSSGLTLWDWLHGTLRLNVPQDEITIGVPAYQDAKEVTLPKIIAMPFKEQRPTWNVPGDGVPTRAPVPMPMPPQRLLP
jgi:hypothetical protein